MVVVVVVVVVIVVAATAATAAVIVVLVVVAVVVVLDETAALFFFFSLGSGVSKLQTCHSIELKNLDLTDKKSGSGGKNRDHGPIGYKKK